ncbi:YbaN family protein [Niallia sp. 01092]|uniref:YbaN family protein n=1 Tax=unclassified Niallia TaxID=2837522 RepID=UPI003FD18B3F
MKPLYRWINITLGTVFLGIGIAGIFLPLLPTTPFLLLTSYFYTRGSDRVNNWFRSTRFYQQYVKDFKRGGLTKKQKIKILITGYICLAISAYLVDHLYARIFLGCIAIGQLVSMFIIKTRAAEPTEMMTKK